MSNNLGGHALIDYLTLVYHRRFSGKWIIRRTNQYSKFYENDGVRVDAFAH